MSPIFSQSTIALVSAIILGSCIADPTHRNFSVASDLDCSIYTRLSQMCPCNKQDDYLIGYGLKYCRKFAVATDWSAAGLAWRNATLNCLRESAEKAVKLSMSEQGDCDCGRVRRLAFASHEMCYTLPMTSFCRLPAGDVDTISSIIDAGDLFTWVGLRQTIDVIGVCIGQRVDDAMHSVRRAFE